MHYQAEIAQALADASGLDFAEINSSIEIPPNAEMGDYAFPCFKLAKVLRKAPPMIAAEIKEKLPEMNFIDRVETVGAYLNFFLDKTQYAKTVLSQVLAEGANYGGGDDGKGKNVVIDYSSPNIAKPFHVGHLRSTVIGGALYRIHSFLGYQVYGINHLGDWGTQFGKLIVAYKNWGSKDAVEEQGISELMRIYVKFHDEAEKNPALEDEARAWFVKMQDGDEEALALWKWFNDISLAEFDRVYKMLGVTFDAYTGESFYNDKMDAVVEELKEKGLLTESQGAMIVDLGEDMPPCLILRKDGGTLYATRDIAAAIYRKKTYDFDKCMIVTAFDQNLHFQQWFKVIEKMGYDWYDKLQHVPFGLVSLSDGKLSTRKGRVVLMEDVLNQAIEKTAEIIREKNPNLPNADEVAKQVGIGAIIFNDLYNGRRKDVVFDFEKMLNFDGETGPYVQYTHARACSILKKADGHSDAVDFSVLTDPASVDVCKLLDMFPAKVREAAEKSEPSVISRHLMDIAQSFNKFYHDNPILNSDDYVKNARLALVTAVETVLKEGLALLGIQAPEQM